MTRSPHDRPAGRAGLLVICAANNWDDVRLSDRPLAEQLARLGPVLFVDPPISHLAVRHNPRVRPALQGSRLRQVGPQLMRLTPVVTPRPFRPATMPLTRLIVRRALGRALAVLGGDVRAVVSTWLLIDVFDLAPRAWHAYWVQDDTAAGAEHWGLAAERLLAGEERIAAAADVVLPASPLAVQRWQARGHRALALPNGCDVERFERAGVRDRGPGGPDGTGPVAGFVGHLNDRSDLALLEAVVDRGMSLLLVGPTTGVSDGPRLARLLARPGVRAVGAQPYEELGHWLGQMDVGLVPYRNDEFNRWSFPLKTLEYLAAGLPVVSAALPAVQWLDSADVVTADDPMGFAAAALRAAVLGREPGLLQQRQAFARRHSWQQRAESLMAMLAEHEPGPHSTGAVRA